MSPRSFLLSDELHGYVLAHCEPPDAVQRALIAETAALPMAMMQISPDLGMFLTMLTGLAGGRNAIEVGTFTGYSSIAIARGLGDGGHLTCFDVSDEWTGIARRYWAEAGVDDRIELRLGPAIEGLRALPAEPTIDFAFVDADKTGYADYLDEIVPRLRPGGLLVADNTLQAGRVVDPAATDDSVEGIRRFNDRAAADDRVDTVLLSISDGITILRKR